MMEAPSASETSVTYSNTRINNPEDCHIQISNKPGRLVLEYVLFYCMSITNSYFYAWGRWVTKIAYPL